MDKDKQVILDIQVKYDDAIAKIADYNLRIDKLRETNRQLRLEMKEEGVNRQELTQKIVANSEVINKNQASIRLLTSEIRSNMKEEEALQGSVVSLRKELTNLTSQYNRLSGEERKSAKGKELQEKINSLRNEVKEAEEAIGDFRRNVGNYEESVRKAMEGTGLFSGATAKLQSTFSPLKALYSSAKVDIDNITAAYKKNKKEADLLSGSQKALAISSNIAVTGLKLLKVALISTGIGALIVALGSLVSYFTKTQKGAEMLSNAMSMVSAAINVIIDRASKVGETLIRLFTGDVRGALKSFKEAYQGIGDEMEREIRLACELNDISIQLEKQEVMLNMQRSSSRKEIERLKMISEDTTKSTKERTEAAQKAAQMEQALISQEIEFGKKRLANLLGQKEVNQETLDILDKIATGAMSADEAISKLGLSESTVADLKEFAEAYQQLEDKQEQSFTKQTELQNKLNSIIKEGGDKQKEAKEKELSYIRAAEDAALSLVKEGIEKQREVINLNYGRQIEDLKHKLSTEKNLTDTTKGAINQTIISLQEQQEKELAKLSQDALIERINKETESIQLKLEAVKSGTQQEHELKIQLIEQNRQAELEANRQLAEELRQSEADINAKYRQQEADANEAFQKAQYDKQSEALRLEWENKLLHITDGSLQEYDLKVQQAQAEYDMLVNMDEATKNALFESQAAYENAVLQSERNMENATKARNQAQREAVQIQLQAAQQIGEGFSSVLEAFAEDNETLAEFAKTVALFNIGLNTAEAISKGVASAQSVPFPGNIAAVAATIATIMANIIKAKQLLSKEKNPKAPKFGGGGDVTGPSHNSGGVLIEAEGGEAVINKRSMSNPLLRSIASAVNVAGGGVPFAGAMQAISSVQSSQFNVSGVDMETLKVVIVEALHEMPAPVVSVVEITDKQNRVKAIEQNATY